MQRSRLRRGQRVKSLRGKVVTIKDEAQWDRVLAKNTDAPVVAHFYAQWNSACKQMRTFFNDISVRPAFSHVTFVEVDVDNDGTSGIARQGDIMTLPTVQFWKGGDCVDVAKGGIPMLVLELINKHAGPRPAQDEGAKKGFWMEAAKWAGAGVAVLAAGVVGYRWLRARGDEEAAVQRRLQGINRRIKEVQKALGGPSRRSRRRGKRLKPDTSAELANLFSQQQALSVQLEQLRRSRPGSGSARRSGLGTERDLVDEEDDEYFSDEDEP